MCLDDNVIGLLLFANFLATIISMLLVKLDSLLLVLFY